MGFGLYMVSERYKKKHGTAKDWLRANPIVPICQTEESIRQTQPTLPEGEIQKPKPAQHNEYSNIKDGMKIQQVQLTGYTAVFNRNEKVYIVDDTLKIKVNDAARTVEFRDANAKGLVCVVPYESVARLTYEE